MVLYEELWGHGEQGSRDSSSPSKFLFHSQLWPPTLTSPNFAFIFILI